MGTQYDQLSFEERCELAELHRAGRSIRQIAAALDRSPSSISRELKRNAGKGPRADPYRPLYAQQQTQARRWSGSKLERNAKLRETVLAYLEKGWSPEQIRGRLRHEHDKVIIGTETIYRFIYAQMKRTNDSSWRQYLPRAKAKRGWRSKPGGSPASFIKHRVPIEQRPDTALDRKEPGHWEADFMLFAIYGQAILALHERTSRLTLLLILPNRKAGPTAQALAKLLEPLPETLRRSLTFDNGTEFAQHHQIGLPTFFCNPHSPWQKGGVENAIGRFRRFLPRPTDLNTLPEGRILQIVTAYNHTPRTQLDFRTPAEVFSALLHFEWESTSRLSSG
jgi:IS30 family transposase